MKPVLEKTIGTLYLKCHLSDDNIKLFIDLAFHTPDPSENESQATPHSRNADSIYNDVMKELEGVIRLERITPAVLKHAIKQLLEGEEVVNRRIAKGKLPDPARDGRIVFLVKKISSEPDLVEDKKGIVDLRSLRLFENIEINQIVARVYPPKRGTSGEDAFGNIIEGGSGEEVHYTTDETLKVTPPKSPQTFSTITSLTEGYLSQQGDALSVNNTLTISGDVDYSTGNIDFIGSVVITGSVLPGFSVRAKKDIIVQGLLDGGRLVSSQGAVQVEKLVAATSPSSIEAATDVTLSVVQGATVRCGQTLKITREARHCTLHSHSNIDMTEAELIGGNAYAICGISAKILGNETGVKTLISFCSDIEMDKEFVRLIEDISRHETALTILRSHLGPYAEQPGRVVLLKEDLKEKMVKLLERFAKVLKSYKELIARREHLLKGSKISTTAAASFSSILYPGVEIVAPDAIFSTPEKISGPASITYDGEAREFSVSDYQAVVCNFRDTKGQEEQVNE